jgi:PAS domain S-box-containing protein
MFMALMDSTPDSIVFADLGGKYVEVSKKKADNWGRSRAEMRGLTDFDLMEPIEAQQARDDSLKVIATGVAITNCRRKAIRNGEVVWYSLSEQPWFDGAGQIIGTISTSRDITDTENLREAMRLFFSDAAHKIKSPIEVANLLFSRIIKGRYGNLDKGDAESQSIFNVLKNLYQQYRMIEKRAHDSLDHVGMLSHTNDVEAISQIQTIDLGRDVFDYLLDIHAATFEENNVYIDGSMGLVPPGEVIIKADLNMLRSVIEQFITNSVKYGKIGKDKLNISYGYKLDDEKIYLNFYNDGQPIDEAFIAQGLLCKPFERANETSEVVEGNGLGMHLVESFMQMMGGGFKYETTRNNHPNFIIWLPISSLDKE